MPAEDKAERSKNFRVRVFGSFEDPESAREWASGMGSGLSGVTACDIYGCSGDYLTLVLTLVEERTPKEAKELIWEYISGKGCPRITWYFEADVEKKVE